MSSDTSAACRKPLAACGLPVSLLLIALVLSLAAALVLQRGNPDVSNLTGRTAVSLIRGHGFVACTDGLGTPGNSICFHAARMPLPSVFVAGSLLLFGLKTLPVTLFKTVVFLIPLGYAMVLAWQRIPPSKTMRRAIALLLIAPFCISAFLADVVNIQVEEAYVYGFLTLGSALLLFEQGREVEFKNTVLMAGCIDAIYLSKSSMLPAAVVLGLACLMRLRRVSLRLLLVILVAAAPIGWAFFQHCATGRYTVGTSLDGLNLHKGNNPSFLVHYPSQQLDQFDAGLSSSQSFTDEWSFNDFHQRAAVEYGRTHPRQELQAALRKFSVFFLSVHKYGSNEDRGVRLAIETGGMVLFRLLLWTAIGASVVGLARGRSWSGAGAIFLALVAACALPYMAGFAYTRHASVLIYPAALMCCRIVLAASR